MNAKPDVTMQADISDIKEIVYRDAFIAIINEAYEVDGGLVHQDSSLYGGRRHTIVSKGMIRHGLYNSDMSVMYCHSDLTPRGLYIIQILSKALGFFQKNQSETSSRWKEKAQWRRDNAYWLNYARAIMLKVLKAMDDKSVTQVELANRLGCTQQYVSNLLKGSVNMTLETIAKLETVLDIDLLKSVL